MSKTMTTKIEHLGVGSLTRPEREAHPLSNYWKALVPLAARGEMVLARVKSGTQHATHTDETRPRILTRA